jgi:hypoxanthine phosphoribosyltransferase
MKLELGSGSKVLGTKRVSAKGQISGLTEYAGKDVMVVLVDSETEASGTELPHELYYKEIQKLVEDQMEKAFSQYKKLGDKFKTPAEASREYIKKMSMEILAERVVSDLNKWLENIVPEKRKDDEDKL